MPINPLRPPTLPTQDDLPCDDGEPMETARHRMQMELLIRSLEPWAQARGDVFVGGNMFLYFSNEQMRGKDFRGPDFFAVLGISPHERKSWVVWDEEKGPDIIVELLSDSTNRIDKTEKKRIYQDRLRVAEYFWFDPWNPSDFAGFRLLNARYEPILPRAPGRIPSALLGLELRWWDGVYGNVEARWIRWATPDGTLLPTADEAAIAAAEAAIARADAAKADAEAAKAEAAAAKADADAARTLALAAEADREAEAQRAAEAEERAREAQAELARLRAQLKGAP